MRKVILFIAMSLDGYIADAKGGVDWLSGESQEEENGQENGDTYADFVKDIDTILMGWNTYHQVVTELSPEEWVYEDFTTYVFTHNKQESTEKIRFTDVSPARLLKKLRMEEGKDIWICGGAKLVEQLMESDEIDRYHISIIPTLLGEGIRLFGQFANERKLSLVKAQRSNGIAELVYERRP